MKEEIKLPETAILCGDPFSKYSPCDIRQWLQENNHTDAAVAEAVAIVNAKTGWLHHELNDPDNDEAAIQAYEREYEGWAALYKELVAEIIRRLEEKNRIEGTNYATDGKGLHYIIEPFMEHNGFQDGAGWWVRK